MHDERLAKAAIRGDRDAFSELMKQHKEKLYRIAYAHFHNEQDSLDAIQETAYRAFISVRKLKEPKYFGTWIVRILLNYCSDELTRRRKTASIPVDTAAPNTMEQSDDKILVAKAVDALQPKYRQVVILKYYEGLSLTEIASLLGHPDGTIKTWLHKSLTELRLWLGRGGESR